MMEHRGYTAVFEYDPELETFAGHVVDLRDQIYFEGSSVEELRSSMRTAVDDYIDFCGERGESPERPFSGRFNVRFESSLHRRVAAAAATEGKSMNEWMRDLVVERLALERERER